MKRTLMMVMALTCGLGLAACSAVPVVDGGAIACVRVDTLTTQTTTVYVAAGQAGAIEVRPDCTVHAQLAARSPAPAASAPTAAQLSGASR